MIHGKKVQVGDVILGISAIFLGLVVAFEAIRDLETHASFFGPALFPGLIAFGLCAVGGVFLRQAFKPIEAPEQVQYDLVPMAIVCAVLVMQMVLISLIGWILSAALLFSGTAYAFGSRAPLRDGAIGLGLGATTFLIFSYLLDLRLPLGSLFEMIS